MLEAATEALEFGGANLEELQSDRLRLNATLRALQVVGEAAANISTETRNQLPAIPWPQVVGMRHRLVHAYFDIDVDRVWDTLTEDIPPLISVPAGFLDPGAAKEHS
jgi:uncharacterized protein with HEPN domain